MRTYRTRQHEVLDHICWRAYRGLRPGLVETVLAANPGLASLPIVLPKGVLIVLPDLAPSNTPPATVKLWD